MASNHITGLTKGVLLPSKEDAQKIIAQIQKDLAAKPELAKLFETHPRGVLSAYGLSVDAQVEILRDAHIKSAAADICIFTDCFHTCWFTDCYLTHIVIKK
jgi:hypothetical protein